MSFRRSTLNSPRAPPSSPPSASGISSSFSSISNNSGSSPTLIMNRSISRDSSVLEELLLEHEGKAKQEIQDFDGPAKRILLLGSRAVDKSTLLFTYLRNEWHEDFVQLMMREELERQQELDQREDEEGYEQDCENMFENNSEKNYESNNSDARKNFDQNSSEKNFDQNNNGEKNNSEPSNSEKNNNGEKDNENHDQKVERNNINQEQMLQLQLSGSTNNSEHVGQTQQGSSSSTSTSSSSSSPRESSQTQQPSDMRSSSLNKALALLKQFEEEKLRQEQQASERVTSVMQPTQLQLIIQQNMGDPDALREVKQQNMLLAQQVAKAEDDLKRIQEQLRQTDTEKDFVQQLHDLEIRSKQELANFISSINHTLEKLMSNVDSTGESMTQGKNLLEQELLVQQDLEKLALQATLDKKGASPEELKTMLQSKTHIPSLTLPMTPKSSNSSSGGEESPNSPRGSFLSRSTSRTNFKEIEERRRVNRRAIFGASAIDLISTLNLDVGSKIRNVHEERETMELLASLEPGSVDVKSVVPPPPPPPPPLHKPPSMSANQSSLPKNASNEVTFLATDDDDVCSSDEATEKSDTPSQSSSPFQSKLEIEKMQHHIFEDSMMSDSQQASPLSADTPSLLATYSLFDLELFKANGGSPLVILNAIRKFNVKQKEGIQYLIDKKLLENHPCAIASFLAQTASLSRVKVGEYIGNQHNSEILRYFCDYFAQRLFKGVIFDVAFRAFLTLVILPPEGQMVTRIAEGFAISYVQVNPNGDIEDSDKATFLACAILMLNTDLHNPTVKKKMSKESFIGLVRETAVADAYLSALYDNIKSNELKIILEEGPNDDDEYLGAPRNPTPTRRATNAKMTRGATPDIPVPPLPPLRSTSLFYKKRISMDGAIISIVLQDTENLSQVAENAHSMPIDKDIYRADFYFVTFGVTDVDGFEKACRLVEHIKNVKSTHMGRTQRNKRKPALVAEVCQTIVLVACNCEEKRNITFQQGSQRALKLGVQYWETSAKRNKNVKEMITASYKQIVEKERQIVQQNKLKQLKKHQRRPSSVKPVAIPFAQIIDSALVFI